MVGIIKSWVAFARQSVERRAAIDALSRMSDAQLRDIGVERGAIADLFPVELPTRRATPAAQQGRAFA